MVPKRCEKILNGMTCENIMTGGPSSDAQRVRPPAGGLSTIHHCGDWYQLACLISSVCDCEDAGLHQPHDVHPKWANFASFVSPVVRVAAQVLDVFQPRCRLIVTAI
jgi:hypothetical protein